MINILKQLVRTSTDIVLQPNGYSFPYVIDMELAEIKYNTNIKIVVC